MNAIALDDNVISFDVKKMIETLRGD